MTQKQFDIPRELFTEQELLQPGMLSCQGCGAALAMKLALMGLGARTIIVLPASCWGVIVGVWPYSTIRVPVVHSPFAAGAVTAAGVRAGFAARGIEDVVVMAWAGDGGTFDIGIQSLSAAAERNEDILYVCYDNEAYMNTGIQRSSATPAGAWTTTTPMGAVKQEAKKDIVKIMLAHSIPYVATASVAYPDDVVYKFKKARRIAGSRFIHLLSPCPPGWRIDSSKSIQVTRMATQAKVFPIYEIENGDATINIQPGQDISVGEYFRAQGRFAEMPADMIARAQQNTDRKWQELEQMSNQDSTSAADGKRFGNIG